LAVFQTSPGIVEQSEGIAPPSPPDEPELLDEPLEELLVEVPELLLVEPELVLVLPEPELLLVELELVLVPEPELLLVDPELLLVDPELLPELPEEEPDPPDDPELDAPPSPESFGKVELVPPQAPTALRGRETARHTSRNRAYILVLRSAVGRSSTRHSCHRRMSGFFHFRCSYRNPVARIQNSLPEHVSNGVSIAVMLNVRTISQSLPRSTVMEAAGSS
jgi:hypothetical protein